MDLTIKETQQAVEGMYHNLNTLQSRSGNQLPFTSINYGTCTLPEGRMVTKALLEGSLKGVGKVHKTPIFPCGIFQCMKGVNRKEGEPNYDLFKLALKSTAKRLYPNYANVDWSVNEGYDRNDPRTYVATMGCRTYNGKDINAEPGVNPQIKDGRGNIAPVTIIMPTLAMEAEGNVDKFFEILDTKIHEAKEMLVERYKHIITEELVKEVQDKNWDICDCDCENCKLQEVRLNGDECMIMVESLINNFTIETEEEKQAKIDKERLEARIKTIERKIDKILQILIEKNN